MKEKSLSKSWLKLGIPTLLVVLVVSVVFSVAVAAQPGGNNNKPLKTPINPVKLESGQVLTPFGIYNVTKMYKTPDGVTHVKGKHISKISQPPAINGWIEDAWAKNANGYGDFLGNWNVPSSPTQTGSLIYLFTGLEPSTFDEILQPVLQWGNNGAFGGNYWTIVAWYVYPNGYIHSTPLNVNVGDDISGYIYPTSTPSQWIVEILDYTTGGATDIVVTTPLTYTYSFVALEGYNVVTCSQLPGDTDFYNLALYDADSGSQITPSWKPWQNSSDVSLCPSLNVDIVSSSEVILNSNS